MTALLDTPASSLSDVQVVFGSGTIGGALIQALMASGQYRCRAYSVPWVEEHRSAVIQGILTEALGRNPSNLDIVWAAGRTGFAADKEECDVELAAFTDVLEATTQASRADDAGVIALHVISSAGGLFEGAPFSGDARAIAPIRPYGHLKAEQERRASLSLPEDTLLIYRISSVYSSPQDNARPGLIGTLVLNGLRRKPTSVYGAMETLRDYVSASDVGGYIARRIANHHIRPTTAMLVSGRPTPISRAIILVERALRRRLLVAFEGAWNAAHITFPASARVCDFRPESLESGIARTVFETLKAW